MLGLETGLRFMGLVKSLAPEVALADPAMSIYYAFPPVIV